MSWWEWLIVGIIVAFVVAVIVVSIVRRKQGKSSCDCGGSCSSCPGCHLNHPAEEKKPSKDANEADLQ